MCVEVRGQIVGISSLLPLSGSQGSFTHWAFSLALKLNSKLQMFHSLFALLLFPVFSGQGLDIYTSKMEPLKGPHREETMTTVVSVPNGCSNILLLGVWKWSRDILLSQTPLHSQVTNTHDKMTTSFLQYWLQSWLFEGQSLRSVEWLKVMFVAKAFKLIFSY